MPLIVQLPLPAIGLELYQMGQKTILESKFTFVERLLDCPQADLRI